MTEYQLVFSVPRDAPWEYWAFGALGIPVFLLGRQLRKDARFVAARFPPAKPPLLPPAVPLLLLQFIAVGVVLLLLVMPGLQYLALWSRLARGRYTQVEGIVESYIPGDAGDHVPESWTVASGGARYRYRYSPSMVQPGYNVTEAHGGVIRAGIRVRLADVDGSIARLEVGR